MKTTTCHNLNSLAYFTREHFFNSIIHSRVEKNRNLETKLKTEYLVFHPNPKLIWDPKAAYLLQKYAKNPVGHNHQETKYEGIVRVILWL